MNTEPNPPKQPYGEPPSQYGQPQLSPYASSPALDGTPQVDPQGQNQPRSLLAGRKVLFIVLAVLLIGGGSGLIYFKTVYQPNVQHTQATATARAQATATAQEQTTAVAQLTGTTQAQTATATQLAVAGAGCTSSASELALAGNPNFVGGELQVVLLNCGTQDIQGIGVVANVGGQVTLLLGPTAISAHSKATYVSQAFTISGASSVDVVVLVTLSNGGKLLRWEGLVPV